MTQQTLNSLVLYKRGNPSTIEQLLERQDEDVVNQLKEHFGTTDMHELALRCSIGF